MRQIKPQQASGTDVWGSPQDQVYFRPDEGRLISHTGPDRDRPVSQLIPRQQIAGEAQKHGEQQQDHPC